MSKTKILTIPMCEVCGSTEFAFKGWRRNGQVAVLECANCGQIIRITNSDVATVTVELETLLGVNTVPRQKVKKTSRAKVRSNDEWVSVSFRITKEQRAVIRLAMEAVKRQLGIQGRMWRGIWLEYAAMSILNECSQQAINEAMAVVQNKEGLSDDEFAALLKQSGERLAEYEGEDDESVA